MERKPFSLSKKVIIITSVIIVVAAATVASIYFINNSKKNTTSSTANSDESITALEKLSEEGKYKEAEKTAEKILKSNPGTDTKLDALWELTLAESGQGKYDEAIEHAKQMNDYEPASSHFLLGIIYFDKKDFTKAKQELTEAKQKDSSLTEQIDYYLEWMKKNAV
ncbi:tetratricopeptide repeat protein [Acetivibrio cellulolyticus]|uniref:tetratricopeptide repeat protein n=1 Tax=Acetivibrio cellulolyticus TaxID=35830 RepID=UPI0001E30528|nr:tetratricopeptide repeat protein [Acetivibrio cellulolyticus]